MEEYEQSRVVSRAEVETILTHGLIALIIGGGAGVYLPLVMGKSISADALATYIFAALAPSWIDMLLPEKYWKELSKKTRLRVGAGCALAGVLGICALLRDGKSWDMTFGTLGTIVVLVVLYHLARLSGRFTPDVRPKTEDGGPGAAVSPDKLGGGGLI